MVFSSGQIRGKGTRLFSLLQNSESSLALFSLLSDAPEYQSVYHRVGRQWAVPCCVHTPNPEAGWRQV